MGFTYPINLDNTGFTPASSANINLADPPTPLDGDLERINPFSMFFLPTVIFLPLSEITCLATLQFRGWGELSIPSSVCI